MHIYGLKLSYKGRHQESYETMNEALNLRKKVLGDKDHDALELMHHVGLELSYLGRHQESYEISSKT